MRHFTILLILTVLLNGCSRKEPIENIGDNAKNDVEMMYTVLPKECKTEAVTIAKENALRQIESVVSYCNLEKDNLQLKIRYRELLIGVLSGLLLLMSFRKFAKFLGLIG